MTFYFIELGNILKQKLRKALESEVKLNSILSAVSHLFENTRKCLK